MKKTYIIPSAETMSIKTDNVMDMGAGTSVYQHGKDNTDEFEKAGEYKGDGDGGNFEVDAKRNWGDLWSD